MNFDDNIMLMSDSYKQSHWKQYPKDTEVIHSYFESRGGKWDTTVFFGLQYYLKKYLQGQVVTQEKIDEAEAVVNAHMGPGTFNRAGWQHILDKYEGRLPVKIRAVPEGTVVPGRNVLMTIENTDPKCFWLTNFLETLLVQVWYGITVATQSREMKKVILKNLEDTGDPAGIDFKLHDFGFRGVSSVETAGLGGCAHLVNFQGTDTMQALTVARKYYGCDMAGFSIPASEHSTITSWGKDNEVDACRNMLDSYPSGLVACVSDSFDIYNACSNIWGRQLHDKVVNRDGTLVVRPDSGHPPTIVCEILEILWDRFGGETNDKGYKVLDSHVRVIQGDGIDYSMLQSILTAMRFAGWSGDNIAFGSGGGLLQKMDRDTLQFAFKCSAIKRGGVWEDVYKDPVTDKGKRSKRGRLRLVKTTDGSLITQDLYPGPGILVDCVLEDEMETVFLNGQVIKEHKLDDIRQRASIGERELSSVV